MMRGRLGASVRDKLQQRLDRAVEGALEARCAVVVNPEANVCAVVQAHEEGIRRGDPILVEAEIKGEDEKTLLGILTPFDLLYAPRFQVQQA